MTKRSAGFTVIELIFVAVIFGLASIFFFTQKHNLEIVARDNTEKTAINAMYYSLEEVYFPANKYYPQTINSDVLRAVDPALFTDPNGKLINTAGSVYTYSPTNCDDNKCTGYTLKAILENEGEYVKYSKSD